MERFRFKNWSLFNKLQFIIFISALPLLLIFIFQMLPTVSEKYYEDKSASVKSVVESAYNIMEYYNQKSHKGEMTLEDAQKSAIDEINILRYSGKEYYFVYTMEGVTMALGSDPSKKGENRFNIEDKLGNKFVQDMINICAKDGEGFVKYYYPKLGETEPSPKLSFVKLYKPWGWFLGSGVYIDDVERSVSAFKEDLYIPTAVAIIFAVLFGFIIARSIAGKIKKLEAAAGKVAGGDTTVQLDIQTKDEIGHLASSFNQMVVHINNQIEEVEKKSSLAEKAAAEAEASQKEVQAHQDYLANKVEVMLVQMEKFADGDLTVSLEVTKDDSIGKLFKGFNLAIQKINDIITKLSEASLATASASTEISSSAEEMAAGSQEQSAQTSEIASAVEQMNKTIVDTTKNATVAAENAKGAGQKAIEGGKVVSQTIEGMNRISDVVSKSAKTVYMLGQNSDKIGEIISVIDDIADQTNLLALNAAIEAARAGEQGRGFAVVADEVRKLAERTTKATKEIADMIKQIQHDTGEAVSSMQQGTKEVEVGKQLVHEAGDVLKEIITSSQKVSDTIVQVAAASEEQSSASEEIRNNIEGISNITNEASKGIQQIARAAEDLNMLTINLQDLVNKFKLDSALDIKNNFTVLDHERKVYKKLR